MTPAKRAVGQRREADRLDRRPGQDQAADALRLARRERPSPRSRRATGRRRSARPPAASSRIVAATTSDGAVEGERLGRRGCRAPGRSSAIVRNRSGQGRLLGRPHRAGQPRAVEEDDGRRVGRPGDVARAVGAPVTARGRHRVAERQGGASGSIGLVALRCAGAPTARPPGAAERCRMSAAAEDRQAAGHLDRREVLAEQDRRPGRPRRPARTASGSPPASRRCSRIPVRNRIDGIAPANSPVNSEERQDRRVAERVGQGRARPVTRARTVAQTTVVGQDDAPSPGRPGRPGSRSG